MNTPPSPPISRMARLLGALSLLTILCACSALQPSAKPLPAFYSLDSALPITPAAAATVLAPTLIVNAPRAAAGFDSSRIIYLREPNKLNYFANSEWVDPPARMLAPLLVAALLSTGAFRAVAPAPSAASGELRLDTEIIRLQQEFFRQPSQVRFTMRVYLVEEKTRRVLAWREFDASVPASREDAQAGVIAAAQAVRTVLEELAIFSAEAARGTSAAP